MALDKKSYQLDAIANLYRAALYLARGSKEVGLEFLEKANKYLSKKIYPKIETRKDCLFWAEKILDEYKRLKMKLA